MLENLLILTTGVIFGSIISNVARFISSTSGTLKIDQSDPEKEIYRLEINNLDVLPKKKHVLLKVDNQANLSQK